MPEPMPPPGATAAPGDAVYRLLFERNPWPMWVYETATLRFLAVNPAAIAVYGYSEAEFLAMRITDIRPEADRAEILAFLDGLGSRSSPSRHWRHRRRNGEVFDVDVLSELIDFGGRPARLVVSKDVTQQLRAERALRDSERRYRDIVDAAAEGIWMIDPQARTRFVNPKMAQMLACGPDRLLGQPLDRFADDAAHVAALQRLAQGGPGPAGPLELRLRRDDGRQLWASVSANPVHDDGGRPAGALAMLTDITERKRAEARDAGRNRVMALIADRSPLGAVLEAIVRGLESGEPDLLCSVLLLDASGTRLRHGAAPSLPDEFNQAVDGQPIGPVAGSCGSAAYLGERVVCEDVLSDPRWADWREPAQRAGLRSCWSEPVRSHAGAVLGSFGVYRREPHRPGDDELAAVAEAARIAAIAIERQHADDALRESQKMESLGTLAGGIAHDFNNILGAILGNVALAQAHGGPAAADAAQVEQIRRSAVRARQLVQQILAFGRRQPPQLLCWPVATLVNDALGLLRATLPAGVRIVTRLADGVPPLQADATQMQQVLMNLCTNAWHAMPGGNGVIEIGAVALPAETGRSPALAALPAGPCVHLWVRDDGAGMDAATQARIFEPFYTTKPVGSGTGLGLAVVHGIVGEHRGVIQVDSAPGRGTTFHLIFPAAPRGAGETAPAAAAVPPLGPALPVPMPAAPGGRPPHVLCVDDDAVILLTHEALLRQQGFRVTALAGADEALVLLRASPQAFDIVLSDFNMPGTSGLDLARAVAAIRADLPVLISSGYIDAQLLERAARAGVRALVRKENLAEELAPAIWRALSG
ncbi:MAG: PAS domain S-box protein [Burkholderiaceae bacterium]|nr:PAS domain S-box protein [Burkholderiaceae bacterium]